MLEDLPIVDFQVVIVLDEPFDLGRIVSRFSGAHLAQDDAHSGGAPARSNPRYANVVSASRVAADPRGRSPPVQVRKTPCAPSEYHANGSAQPVRVLRSSCPFVDLAASPSAASTHHPDHIPHMLSKQQAKLAARFQSRLLKHAPVPWLHWSFHSPPPAA